MRATCSGHLTSLDMITVMIGENYKLRSSVPPSTCYILTLSSKHSPQRCVPQHPQLMLSLSGKKNVSHGLT